MAFDYQSGMDTNTDQTHLDINQAGEKKERDTTPKDYPFTPDEEKLVKEVMDKFQKFKKWRKKYDKDWLENYKMFRGDQWKYKRPAYRQSEVINLIFRAIQSTVPMQTDARPKFEFLPQEPKDFKLAEILNMVCASDWEKQNWLYVIMEMLYDAHIYSCSYGHMGYDDKAYDGLGAVLFESEDPFLMYPDPNARDINDNGKRSRGLFKAEPVDIDILKDRYPKFAQYFKSDVGEFSSNNREITHDLEGYVENQLSDVDLLENDGKSGQSGRNQAMELSYWCKSNETEVVEEPIMGEQVDPMTGQPVQVQVGTESVTKLKYPNGKKIVIVNKIPVVNEANEFDDGKFPYVKHVNYILPREFFGMSEIDQIKGPQRIFNTLVSYALDVLVLMGNPIWVVDTNSQVDTEELYNKPGLVVEKAPNSEVRREAGVQLQPFVLDLISKIKLYVDEISGDQDVSRGVANQVTAARAIDSLQEAAHTRVRQKSKLLDKVLQEAGQMYMSRVFQFYDAPRIFRLTAGDGSTQYFKFHVNEGSAIFQQLDGNVVGDPQTLELSQNFDVKVTTGSSLSIAKADKFNKGVQLFDRKAISMQSLLEAAEWPNIPQEMERVRQEQMIAMQAQMAQQNALQPNQQMA